MSKTRSSLPRRLFAANLFSAVLICAFGWLATTAAGATFNLKVVTDASPDYSDMPSFIHSATSKWSTPEQKCWALFYWNHIGRRQTQPMILHGCALTDPIRQFNDYGHTMCSTISGINCSIWDAMGLRSRYWDITLHTVPEVEYGGRFHMYDNSMSALYTLCDGKTLAGVEDIGKEGACAASGGKVEPGHIARYHCLTATSPCGFLTGADTVRSLEEEAHCFNPKGLKYRDYFYDWDRGHRYILNLRENETYTRYYSSRGSGPEFYVPNGGKDPDAANPHYHIRGNGIWTFEPILTKEGLAATTHQFENIKVIQGGGVMPADATKPGEIVFKLEGANVITGVKIQAQFEHGDESPTIAVSTVNGLAWRQVWQSDKNPVSTANLTLINEVNGSYEVLVKVRLERQSQLKNIRFETTTMLNSKTQPNLLLGRNTVYVGAGNQTESIVFWPDLQGTNYRPYVVEEKNILTRTKHPEYMGVMYAANPREPAYVVFRADAPRDVTRVTYGGRLYNRALGSHIDFLHSFDNGKTWEQTYSLTNTSKPWDVLHYETVEKIPAGTRSVLFKYVLQSPATNTSQPGTDVCSLYSVRTEVNHQPVTRSFKPLLVTFNWSERQADYSLKERSHTELVTSLPHRYVIDVGGADHPVVNSLRIASAEALPKTKLGYSDDKDTGGNKFIGRWVTYGKNLGLHKPYSVSVPSGTQWDAGDPNGTKLTDGVVGPPYAGGTAPREALLWSQGSTPEITVDLGQAEHSRAFRIGLGAGYPWWDSLKGEVKDQVEVLTSLDGRDFTTQGHFNLSLRWKDLPANHIWPDDETLQAHLFELIAEHPVQARFVRFKLTPARILTVSEVQVLDSMKYAPFSLRVSLPDE
jgi:hypothetical protein